MSRSLGNIMTLPDKKKRYLIETVASLTRKVENQLDREIRAKEVLYEIEREAIRSNSPDMATLP